MKILVVITAFALLFACSTDPGGNTQTSNRIEHQPMRSEKLQDTAVHTTENQTPKPPDANIPTGGKWSQSGDPIDTAKFDKVIADAEKVFKAKPSDEAAKKALSQAYFERGFALTEARQYASALGDYRRALKLDPTNEESKKWIDTIVGIYVSSVKKAPPKEGDEPPPLPFSKKTDQ
ncbi:MAG: tetratricopeptide repeat protein [Pyrinomonadaceae bacterium]